MISHNDAEILCISHLLFLCFNLRTEYDQCGAVAPINVSSIFEGLKGQVFVSEPKL